MHKSIACIVMALLISVTAAWSDSGANAMENQLKQLEIKAADAKAGKVAEYAPDALKEALSTISAAQGATAGGNQKLSQQKIEMATLLLTVAEAKAAERELLEKVAVQRVELKKLESQLERYLHGEEK